jgi:hypothetical protein
MREKRPRLAQAVRIHVDLNQINPRIAQRHRLGDGLLAQGGPSPESPDPRKSRTPFIVSCEKTYRDCR